jgi:hypothetical protein
MAQLQAGTTYSNTSPGNQVNATNLNAHVNAAILLPGAITDQTLKNTPTTADQILIHSAADSALRRATLDTIPVAPSQLSSTVPVASGGTGTTTITGYVKGNGTSAFSASATIPVGDLSGTLSVAAGGTGTTTVTGYVKGSGTSAFTGSATVPVTDLSGTLSVAGGGTGTTTITGYVKGNGTSAFSASATIPFSDITGTLAVAAGGTGATSLTGYVKGSGTSALTASATVPFADVTGTVPIAQGGTGTTTAPLARVALNQGVTALTDAATITTDCATNNVFSVTLGGNRTLGSPSNPVAGATYLWIITQDGTGSRTLAYNAVFKFPNGLAPTLSTGANKIDVLSGIYTGSAFLCALVNDLS